jgi:hypothetical protein
MFLTLFSTFSPIRNFLLFLRPVVIHVAFRPPLLRGSKTTTVLAVLLTVRFQYYLRYELRMCGYIKVAVTNISLACAEKVVGLS